MKVVHIYPEPCEYAYPKYNNPDINQDAFDNEILRFTDLEVRYLTGLTQLGVKCVFFYPRKFRVKIKEFKHNGGYRIIRFPISFKIGSVYYPMKMLRYLLKEKPDLVHYHNIYGGGKYFYFRFYNVVALFCKVFKIPFFGWYHTGSLEPIPKIYNLRQKHVIIKKIDDFLRTWSFNISRGITSINHLELERLFNPDFLEYYGFKIKTPFKKVTPNTFSADTFYPTPREEALQKVNLDTQNCYILFVSRIIESKGLHDIIIILPDILKKHPNVNLLVIGDYLEGANDYKIKLESLIAKLGLKNHIHFLGRVEHHQGLLYYYNSADLFILPTYKESFGGVNLEALACGIPVISSNIEEIPYYIKPGMGILTEPGDKLQLRKAILSVLNGDFKFDKELTKKELQLYEYVNAVKQLLDWYKNVLNTNAGKNM